MEKKRLLPPGESCWTSVEPGAEEAGFGEAMRTWRVMGGDSALDWRRAELWSLMEGYADRSVSPFHCADARASAAHNAVSSGSLAALALVARAAGPERMAQSVDRLGQDGDRPGMASRPGTILGDAWAGRRALGGTCARMVRALVALGAHPDGSARAPGKPMRTMIQVGDAEAVSELLALGADPWILGAGGATMMHAALGRGEPSEEVWRALLGAGLDPWAKDAKGLSPFDAAHQGQGLWVAAERERLELLGSVGPALKRGAARRV